ncbi:putative RNA methyltransferase [Gordonia zhaorongruii]|uniref:putative RNA methyltransferase n=1 Tax=Gordonia zhaorongruii TaxID=2597659 RepID=UPI001F2DA728|nr:methyltransferase [Gordonia zhaorongruii]
MCAGVLDPDGRALGCERGHRFDLARQGYASLLAGKATAHRSDTAQMVAARARVFDAGLYDPIVTAVAQTVSSPRLPLTGDSPLIIDAGGGTGSYLSSALDRAPGSTGVSIDLSKFCARAAARAHPRIVSVVADVWAGLPVCSGVADAALSVFAPRNVADTARVLADGGRWVIVTPNPGHLAEVVGPLGMLRVGEGKQDRLSADLAAAFDVVSADRVTARRRLDTAQLADVAGMGPAGFHRSRSEIEADAGALARGGQVEVTLDVTVTLARRRSG